FVLSVIVRHALRWRLFPYATLFRSCWAALMSPVGGGVEAQDVSASTHPQASACRVPRNCAKLDAIGGPWHQASHNFAAPCRRWRSEEHTSELQSRENLVCRLLLEKK